MAKNIKMPPNLLEQASLLAASQSVGLSKPRTWSTDDPPRGHRAQFRPQTVRKRFQQRQSFVEREVADFCEQFLISYAATIRLFGRNEAYTTEGSGTLRQPAAMADCHSASAGAAKASAFTER